MTVTVRNEPQEAVSRELNDNQRRAAELMSLGVAQVRVARALDIREATISEWKRWPEFQAFLNELRTDARQSFKEAQSGLAALAAETLAELMLKGNPELRTRIALAVWSRGLGDDKTADPNASAVGASILAALRNAREVA